MYMVQKQWVSVGVDLLRCSISECCAKQMATLGGVCSFPRCYVPGTYVNDGGGEMRCTLVNLYIQEHCVHITINVFMCVCIVKLNNLCVCLCVNTVPLVLSSVIFIVCFAEPSI